jgi:Zn-dependent protease with chaperone function
MSMDSAQFEALVHRMEQFAARQPSVYRLRMVGFAILGYAYLLAVIVAVVLLSAVSVIFLVKAPFLGAKALLILLPLLVIILRSLWVRLPAPEGVRVTRRDAPALFEMLDRLREQLKTPRIHVVLVTPDLNAGITQVPRLGLFGWHRNYLILGVALMKCLTVAQLESVLAHELGHLSHGHARLGNWIYRMRRMWQQLENAVETKAPIGGDTVRSFFRWYIPRFAAASYPLARRNEFDADATSIAVTSPQVAAQALTNTSVMAHYLQERYWPSLHARAREEAQPSFGPYRELNARAREGLEAADTQRWLEQAMARTTTYDDTHPCLAERLAAIRAQAEVVLPEPDAASDTLFGSHREVLDKRFDQEWLDRIELSWKAVYQRTQANREHLKALRERAAAGPLDLDDSLALAGLEEAEGAGPDAALAMRRALFEREPSSVWVRFALGRQLLQRDELEGVPLVQETLDKDPEANVAGAELLRDFWWRKGDRQLAQQWHDHLVQAAQGLQQSRQERMNRQLHAGWKPHELSPEAVQTLLAQLQKVPGLRSAFLARSVSDNGTDPPVHVLGFGAQRFGYVSPETVARISEQLSTAVAFDGLIAYVEGTNGWLKSKFEAIPGSQIL